MSKPQQVSVWALQDRRKRGVPKPWVVRWSVERKEHAQTFSHRAPAEQHRARLITAVANGERFDRATGLPDSWSTSNMTVALWGQRWIAHNWAEWKPNTRRSYVEAVERFLLIAISPMAPAPPEGIRSAVVNWLCAGFTSPADTPCPAWVKKWSVQLSSLDTATCLDAERQLSLTDTGELRKASTARRFRNVARAMISDAATARHISTNPWPAPQESRRKRGKTTVKRSVNMHVLPSVDEVRAALARVPSHQPGSSGIYVILALVYFAGLRPAEARAIHIDDLTLPVDGGWGNAFVHRSITDAGRQWTGGEDEIEGDTKTSVDRDVPLAPELVDILRSYVGDKTSGPLVRTKFGNPPSGSNISRAWHRAQGEQTKAHWNVYALRHAAATTWLSAGVPIGDVARRLGHSPEVLLRIYAGIINGDTDAANARIEAALSKKV